MSDTWPEMRQQRRAAQVESWMLRAELGAPRHNWHHHAECAGCRRFDLTLCGPCPVRLDCLRAAVLEERDNALTALNIRGGLDPQERRSWYRAHPVIGVIEHGTDPAYKRCRKRPEGACDECKAGHSRYENERRKKGAA